MTTAGESRGTNAWFAMGLAWGGIGLALLLPWIVHVAVETARGSRELGPVLREFWMLLFTPGYHFYLIGIVNAAPFILFAVFLFLHLGFSPRAGALVARRRVWGVSAAALVGLALSAWLVVSIMTSRSSTAAIGYLFLPFYVGAALAIGYGCGRLLGRFAVREREADGE